MKRQKIIIVLFSLLALSACQSVKKELGVGRHSPDEFTVVKRAPLTLPPDYALRAPGDGSVPPASRVSEQAKTALMGEASADASLPAGDADSSLLMKMGVTSADPNIRAVINEENGYLALENRTVADKLLSPGEPPSMEKIPASVVDPAKEKERIEKNAEEGKPVNEGDVPVIEKKKGTIDKIF